MEAFGKAWALGVLLILAFAVAGELLVLFGDFVFYRLGINRDLVMGVLWALPFAASYVASRYSPTRKVVSGLSFLLLLPLIGTTTHLLAGALGGTVDFEGLSGARVVFGLYLGLGSLLIIAGTFLGLLLSRPRGTASES